MRFLLLGGLLALIVWLMLVRPTPQDLRRYMKRGLLVAVAALLILAVVTGRLHWLFAMIGAALPFANRLFGLLRYLPLLSSLRAHYHRARSAGGPAPGNQSSVSSAWLRMTLDHDSGNMDGEVLQGQFAGRRLSQLDLATLRALYDEIGPADEESRSLLRAYLEREHGQTWDEPGSSSESGPPRGGAMSRTEALDILGLADGATIADVKAAHRRLMQKLHPDRGGSDYLAAKINRAKDELLRKAEP